MYYSVDMNQMPPAMMQPPTMADTSATPDHPTSTSHSQMPSPTMESNSLNSTMEARAMNADRPIAPSKQPILVEMRLPMAQGMSAFHQSQRLTTEHFQLDTNYDAIPMGPADTGTARGLSEGLSAGMSDEIIVVRGYIEPDRIAELEAQPHVLNVYLDTPIAPFSTMLLEKELEKDGLVPEISPAAAPACPIGTCDCSPGTAKGTIGDVARYLGVDQIWAAGYRGEGIVVGVVDGGITAEGRPVIAGETTRRIPRVIGGWPIADWGTRASSWGNHGNMCSTDVLGMAPQAQIYDIRIGGGDITATISAALAGFQWAINQHKTNGTPHVLTNSWGIFQESWDTVYARNPNHIFTRKVVEAINEGILVLFAAGNCGGTCPDGRCGPDSGVGRSIWGANGHPAVMTVGAVNKNEQFVGYSSQGPAALDPQKPDFCSITHFLGYNPSDSGTSAATPIAAGVVALLKQVNPSLTQDAAKNALKSTAKDIGPAGFDVHSGSGIIQGKRAFDQVVPRWSDWETLGGFCTDGVAISSWAENRLDTFVVGNDRTLYHKWWAGAGWSDWETLGGGLYSAPAAVSWGPNRIDVFAIGGDHAMWHKWWDGSSWSGWETLGGFCTDGVAVASWAENRLDCFVVGNDRALYHKWWDGSTWSAWETLGGSLYSAPTAVSWGPNRIDVFAIGGDHAMWHKWWDGSSWSGWETLGGFCTDGVAVASWAANRLDTFVVGNDRAMYHKWWDGSSWSGWENLGGALYAAPAAVSWGLGRIDAVVLGGDHAMYHKWYG
jgi:serine protease AprX